MLFGLINPSVGAITSKLFCSSSTPAEADSDLTMALWTPVFWVVWFFLPAVLSRSSSLSCTSTYNDGCWCTCTSTRPSSSTESSSATTLSAATRSSAQTASSVLSSISSTQSTTENTSSESIAEDTTNTENPRSSEGTTTTTRSTSESTQSTRESTISTTVSTTGSSGATSGSTLTTATRSTQGAETTAEGAPTIRDTEWSTTAETRGGGRRANSGAEDRNSPTDFPYRSSGSPERHDLQNNNDRQSQDGDAGIDFPDRNHSSTNTTSDLGDGEVIQDEGLTGKMNHSSNATTPIYPLPPSDKDKTRVVVIVILVVVVVCIVVVVVIVCLWLRKNKKQKEKKFMTSHTFIVAEADFTEGKQRDGLSGSGDWTGKNSLDLVVENTDEVENGKKRRKKREQNPEGGAAWTEDADSNSVSKSPNVGETVGETRRRKIPDTIQMGAAFESLDDTGNKLLSATWAEGLCGNDQEVQTTFAEQNSISKSKSGKKSVAGLSKAEREELERLKRRQEDCTTIKKQTKVNALMEDKDDTKHNTKSGMELLPLEALKKTKEELQESQKEIDVFVNSLKDEERDHMRNEPSGKRKKGKGGSANKGDERAADIRIDADANGEANKGGSCSLNWDDKSEAELEHKILTLDDKPTMQNPSSNGRRSPDGPELEFVANNLCRAYIVWLIWCKKRCTCGEFKDNPFGKDAKSIEEEIVKNAEHYVRVKQVHNPCKSTPRYEIQILGEPGAFEKYNEKNGIEDRDNGDPDTWAQLCTNYEGSRKAMKKKKCKKAFEGKDESSTHEGAEDDHFEEISATLMEYENVQDQHQGNEGKDQKRKKTKKQKQRKHNDTEPEIGEENGEQVSKQNEERRKARKKSESEAEQILRKTNKRKQSRASANESLNTDDDLQKDDDCVDEKIDSITEKHEENGDAVVPFGETEYDSDPDVFSGGKTNPLGKRFVKTRNSMDNVENINEVRYSEEESDNAEDELDATQTTTHPRAAPEILDVKEAKTNMLGKASLMFQPEQSSKLVKHNAGAKGSSKAQEPESERSVEPTESYPDYLVENEAIPDARGRSKSMFQIDSKIETPKQRGRRQSLDVCGNDQNGSRIKYNVNGTISRCGQAQETFKNDGRRRHSLFLVDEKGQEGYDRTDLVNWKGKENGALKHRETPGKRPRRKSQYRVESLALESAGLIKSHESLFQKPSLQEENVLDTTAMILETKRRPSIADSHSAVGSSMNTEHQAESLDGNQPNARKGNLSECTKRDPELWDRTSPHSGIKESNAFQVVEGAPDENGRAKVLQNPRKPGGRRHSENYLRSRPRLRESTEGQSGLSVGQAEAMSPSRLTSRATTGRPRRASIAASGITEGKTRRPTSRERLKLDNFNEDGLGDVNHVLAAAPEYEDTREDVVEKKGDDDTSGVYLPGGHVINETVHKYEVTEAPPSVYGAATVIRRGSKSTN